MWDLPLKIPHFNNILYAFEVNLSAITIRHTSGQNFLLLFTFEYEYASSAALKEMQFILSFGLCKMYPSPITESLKIKYLFSVDWNTNTFYV